MDLNVYENPEEDKDDTEEWVFLFNGVTVLPASENVAAELGTEFMFFFADIQDV